LIKKMQEGMLMKQTLIPKEIEFSRENKIKE
jgi:hypothetical protein